ncbi:MAG TPA: serine hydrolase [Sediminibacterium sp.]|uniref:serine hydrolase n=1 Tax=Sediminibacterium sp. TaxID=1917865 RepID=UPI000AD6C902|nr:serine hydrolase [Sediminibacterium sp.]HLD53950.1 serine hydrolase [Sediminibacterium sp.]HQS23365.1 serine hydrolase [Sediminibacterium sp.]HQS35219.1 serine hydrolase [Sediminibacterium sp.]
MKHLFFLTFILFFTIMANGQVFDTRSPLHQAFNNNPQWFSRIASNPDSFRVQIIYTQINRNKKNKPSFKEFSYRLNNQEYFYPASTVKMPIALLALEKINELGIKGLTRNSIMITDSASASQDHVYNQPNANDGAPTIENYIKQIFLVSDNDAFNRLYEFLGQEYIQRKLKEKGYPDVIIRHRLQVNRTVEQQAITNPVKFYDTAGNLIYEQPSFKSNAVFETTNVMLGKGYMKNGKLINQPFSFLNKNRIYLQDLHHILQSVIFPEQFPRKKRFNLTEDDYAFVKKYMSIYPRESESPSYDSSYYYDTYCKFLLQGSERKTLYPNVKIYNKVGDAYGFLLDIAYITDPSNNIEFMLSAVISCNTDGIYNDDQYEYDAIGFPFMRDLGIAIYQQELQRKGKLPIIK